MKKITLNCPHCGQPFALADALSESERAELAKHFNAPEAQLQLRQQIADEFSAEQRLRELEREKLILDLRASVQALQIKLAASSQQSAGDALEVELLDSLSRAFPHDLFERVGKGRNGGDLIHTCPKFQRGNTGDNPLGSKEHCPMEREVDRKDPR